MLTRDTRRFQGDAAPPRIDAPATAVFDRIDAFDSVGAARSDWDRLEATAPASPYQRTAWAEAWSDTIGAASSLRPCIIVAYDDAGAPTALLPLVRRVRAGLRTATFLGGKDSNANLGLFAHPELWDETAIRRLLGEASRRVGIDLFVLQNQPEAWEGHSNPLLMPGLQPSPSAGRMAALDRELSARLSKHARKTLRQKNTRLRELGAVEHRVARTPAEAEAFVAAYMLQKSTRSETTGIATPSDALAAFLRNGALPAIDKAQAIELHALACGDEIVATFAGAGHRGRFSGMVIGFDQRPTFARCSPGDLLIAAVMTDLRARGFASFDLGIGEARYKETFCDTVEPMFDSLIATTFRGSCASLIVARLLWVKGTLKRSPRASSLIRWLRTSMNRLRSANLVNRRRSTP